MSRTIRTLAAATLVAGVATPAKAHTVCERVIESAEWAIDPTTVGRLRGCLSGLNRPGTSNAAPHLQRWPAGSPDSRSVEAWRPLVAAYFPAANVGMALRVMGCESRGDPDAYNPSGASGLFQHMAQYWPDRAAKAGWAGANIFDPEANIAVAAWLSGGGSDWSHWRASRGCWG